jgi:hypothetical protein
MFFDEPFTGIAGALRDPGMGTEQLGPLLYSLARFVRAERVLEVGVGYTTPFLLKALADNRRDFEQGAACLREKTRRYREARDAVLAGNRPATEQIARLQPLQDRWAGETPPLGDPRYYRRGYRPVLYAVDDLSANTGLEVVLRQVAGELGLASILAFASADFRGFSRRIPPEGRPLDLAWFDCGGYNEYGDFLEEYWDLVRPDGGLVVLHATLGNPFLSHVVKDLKLRQAAGRDQEFEILSLLEPHKFHQHSVTLVRRTVAYREDFETARRAFTDLNSDEPASDLLGGPAEPCPGGP